MLDKAIEHGKEYRKPYRRAKGDIQNMPKSWELCLVCEKQTMEIQR